MTRLQPRSTLFPYTTLFRSSRTLNSSTIISRDYQFGYIDGISVCPHVINTRVVTISECIHHRAVTGDRCWCSTRCWSNRITTGISNGWWCWRHCLSRTLNSSTIISRDYQFGYIDRISVCPHVINTSAVTISECIHHRAVTGDRCWCSTRCWSNRITTGISNGWWCWRHCLSRTLNSSTIISRDYQFGYIDRISVCPHVINTSAVTISECIHHRAVTGDRCWCSTRCWSNRITTGISNGWWCWRHCLSRTLNSSTIISRDYQFGYIDGISVCPHVINTSAVTISECIHHRAVTGDRCWCSTRCWSNRITTGISNGWWCWRHCLSRTLNSSTIISRDYQFGYIDRISVCPHVINTSAVTISECIHHRAVTGDRCWCSTRCWSNRITTGISNGWWCWRHCLSRTLNSSTIISRDYQFGYIDGISVCPHVINTSAVTISECIHHRAVTGDRCWCSTRCWSNRITTGISNGWWCWRHCLSRTLNSSTIISRDYQFGYIDTICAYPKLFRSSAVTISECIHHRAVTGDRCWCSTRCWSNRITTGISNGWWCWRHCLSRTLNSSTIISRDYQFGYIDRISVCPHVINTSAVTVSECIHHRAVTGDRCWCSTRCWSNRITTGISNGWWCWRHCLSRTLNSSTIISRDYQFGYIDGISVCPHVINTSAVTISECIHHRAVTGDRCWCSTRCWSNRITTGISNGWWCWRHCLSRTLNSSTIISRDYQFGYIDRISVCPHVINTSAVTISECIHHRAVTGDRCWCSTRCWSNRITTGISNGWWCWRHCLSRTLNSSTIISRDYQFGYIDGISVCPHVINTSAVTISECIHHRAVTGDRCWCSTRCWSNRITTGISNGWWCWRHCLSMTSITTRRNSRDYQFGYIDRISVCPHVINTSAVTISECIHHRAVTGDRCWCSTRCWSNRITTGISNGWWCWRHCLSRTLNSSTIISRDYQFGYIDGISVCPHVINTRVVTISECIHHRAVTGDRCWCSTRCWSNRITTGISNGWWCWRHCLSRTLNSSTIISRDYQFGYIDRISVCPHVINTSAVTISECIHHRAVTGDRCWCSTRCWSNRITTGISNGWWCWRHCLSRTLNSSTIISRDYQFGYIDGISVCPHVINTSAVTISECIHHRAVTGDRCWCSTRCWSNRITTGISNGWWCWRHCLSRTLNSSTIISRDYQFGYIDGISVCPHVINTSAVTISECIHHRAVTGDRCWCSTRCWSNRITTGISNGWWCWRHCLSRTLNSSTIISRDYQFGYIDRISVCPHVINTSAVTISECIHHRAVTGDRCWCSTRCWSNRITTGISNGWWCWRHCLSRTLNSSTIISRDYQFGYIDRISVCPHVINTSAVTISECIHHRAVTGDRCWCSTRCWSNRITTGISNGWWCWRHCLSRTLNSSTIISRDYQFGYIDRISVCPHVINTSAVTISECIHHRAVTGDRCWCSTRCWSNRITTGISNGWWCWRHCLSRTLNSSTIVSRDYQFGYIDRI